jgi:hypothetical protein
MEIIKTLDNIDFTSFDTFFDSVNGKAYNLNDENPNGAQCWAGILLLYRHLGQKLSSGGSENAKDGWLDKQARRQNGSKNFTKIAKIKDVIRGDVVFFDDGKAGHVAYVCGTYDQESMSIEILGQNQGIPSDTKGSPFSVVKYSVNGFLGAYRFKGWNIPVEEVDELGTETPKKAEKAEKAEKAKPVKKQPAVSLAAIRTIQKDYCVSPFRIGDTVAINLQTNPVWYDGTPVRIHNLNLVNSFEVVAYRGTAVMIRLPKGGRKPVDRPIESKYLELVCTGDEKVNLPVYGEITDTEPLFSISNTARIDLLDDRVIRVNVVGEDKPVCLNATENWRLLTGKMRLSRTKTVRKKCQFNFDKPIWGSYRHNGLVLWVQLNNHKAMRR